MKRLRTCTLGMAILFWHPYLFSGQVQSAEQETNTGLQTRVQAVIHFSRGADFQQQRDLKRALEEYKEALRLNDRFAEAYNNLGTVYFSEGQYGAAQQAYEKALNLAGDLAAAHCNLGTVLAHRAYSMHFPPFYMQAIEHL